MFRLRFTLGTALGVGLMALNLAACSSSGSGKASAAGNGSPSMQATTSNASTAATNATSPPAGANGSASAPSAAAAPPASGSGEPLAPIGCGGITPAMVNDLVTTPVTSITYSSGFGVYPDHHFECDAGMRVDVYPQDSGKSQYTADLTAENVAPNPLSGVGDVAVYTLATLAGMPDIYAHKGTVTCEILPSSTVTDYKVTVDPNSAFGGMITKDAGAAWATKAAGLCTAIFAALKA
jgi:hypothetical protein